MQVWQFQLESTGDKPPVAAGGPLRLRVARSAKRMARHDGCPNRDGIMMHCRSVQLTRTILAAGQWAVGTSLGPQTLRAETKSRDEVTSAIETMMNIE